MEKPLWKSFGENNQSYLEARRGFMSLEADMLLSTQILGVIVFF